MGFGARPYLGRAPKPTPQDWRIYLLEVPKNGCILILCFPIFQKNRYEITKYLQNNLAFLTKSTSYFSLLTIKILFNIVRT